MFLWLVASPFESWPHCWGSNTKEAGAHNCTIKWGTEDSARRVIVTQSNECRIEDPEDEIIPEDEYVRFTGVLPIAAQRRARAQPPGQGSQTPPTFVRGFEVGQSLFAVSVATSVVGPGSQRWNKRPQRSMLIACEVHTVRLFGDWRTNQKGHTWVDYGQGAVGILVPTSGWWQKKVVWATHVVKRTWRHRR